MFLLAPLQYLIIPAIVLVVLLLYPLLGRFINKFTTKGIKRTSSKLKGVKDVRTHLVVVAKDQSRSDEVRLSAKEGVEQAIREEVGLRAKKANLQSLKMFNKFAIWVSRILSAMFLSYGFFLLVASIGVTVAVTYVTTIMTSQCTVNFDANSNKSSKSSDKSSKLVKSDKAGFSGLSSEAKDWAKGYQGFTFIGDSLGVGVESKLKGYFPKSNFNSKVGRMFTNPNKSLNGIETLKDMTKSGDVKDVLVIALGTNQPPTKALMDSMVKSAPSGVKTIIWVNTASRGGGGGMNTVDYNGIAKTIKDYVGAKSNQAYLDWNSYVEQNLKWSDITSDSVHMKPDGYKKYADFLNQGIYDLIGSSKAGDGSELVGDLVTCKPSFFGKKASDDKKKEESNSGVSDGSGEVPADVLAWGYKPNELPASLKPYIIDPTKYGIQYGGGGWLENSGQCVDLTETLGNAIWGHQGITQGNGINQADAWSSGFFKNSVKSKPAKGAIFSSGTLPYGHTGIVCHVFADGSILIVEQNTQLSGIDLFGKANTWNYRVIRKDNFGSEGIKFAYSDKDKPNIK